MVGFIDTVNITEYDVVNFDICIHVGLCGEVSDCNNDEDVSWDEDAVGLLDNVATVNAVIGWPPAHKTFDGVDGDK